MQIKPKSKPLVFDVKKTVKYRTDGAEYDLDVSEALFEQKKYPYALFIGHLALEKILKALVVKKTKQHAPYTHSLPLLAQKTGLELSKVTVKRLGRFMEFHFEARYPEEQKKFYKKCTKKFASKCLEEIREVYGWFNEKL